MPIHAEKTATVTARRSADLGSNINMTRNKVVIMAPCMAQNIRNVVMEYIGENKKRIAGRQTSMNVIIDIIVTGKRNWYSMISGCHVE